MTARRLLQIVPVQDALLDRTPDELAWKIYGVAGAHPANTAAVRLFA